MSRLPEYLSDAEQEVWMAAGARLHTIEDLLDHRRPYRDDVAQERAMWAFERDVRAYGPELASEHLRGAISAARMREAETRALWEARLEVGRAMRPAQPAA